MATQRFLYTNKATCLVVAVTALFSTATALAEVRIVALGSSSIYGYGVPRDQTYPAQLEAGLRARGHQVTVTNQGVNADTTPLLLARLDNAVPPGTDIVLLRIGGNDRYFHVASPAVTAANTRALVERIRAKGAEVYRDEKLEKMQQGIWNRADLHVETRFFDYLPQARSFLDMETYTQNRWHLNAAGYAIVVGRTLPAIEALVRKVEKRR